MDVPAPVAWLLTGACLLGVLAGCGHANATAGPRPAASEAIPWSGRDDFETWEPPLPPGQDGESPRLRPGEQRTYAMRLLVPEGLPGHEVLFIWGFVDNMPDYDAQEWIGLSS